jgi:hypothetical protein
MYALFDRFWIMMLDLGLWVVFCNYSTASHTKQKQAFDEEVDKSYFGPWRQQYCSKHAHTIVHSLLDVDSCFKRGMGHRSNLLEYEEGYYWSNQGATINESDFGQIKQEIGDVLVSNAGYTPLVFNPPPSVNTYNACIIFKSLRRAKRFCYSS